MKKSLLTALWLALALSGFGVLAQNEASEIRRATELRETPNDAARSLAALAAQTPVSRLAGRQGGWVQIKTAQGSTGWVHLFDVGPIASPTPSGNAATSALRGITSLFNQGKAQPSSTGSTALIGIRGLGAEDIANATPNPQAVSQVEALRADAGQARKFASDADLTARVVAPLPAPSSPNTAGGNNPN